MIRFLVQWMAAAAMGLKVSIESGPLTALSWLPRMIDSGLRFRTFWIDLVGRGAVADEVAQADVMIDLSLLDELQQGVEGFEVAVDVAEDQVPHAGSFRECCQVSIKLVGVERAADEGPRFDVRRSRGRGLRP